eukprot:GHVS01085615.1.p1 GENE.GHVS01085615.1~~GHVS01085615.1.p1  ORF type:complete len:834 (+),score=130.60 GHVS01085615.1:59-2560(+)
MKSATIWRVVEGAGLLIIGALCITLTFKAFGENSLKDGSDISGGVKVQQKHEVETFLKNFFQAIPSQRLLDQAENFFAQDGSIHLLMPDTDNGFFSQKYKDVVHDEKKEHQWQELTFKGFDAVKKVTEEFLKNIPETRQWTHKILMMKEVSEGANMVVVEGNVLTRSGEEARDTMAQQNAKPQKMNAQNGMERFIDVFLVVEDASVPMGFKVRSISSTRGMIRDDAEGVVTFDSKDDRISAHIDLKTKEAVRNLLNEFYDGMASDTLSTDEFFTDDASVIVLRERSAGKWGEEEHSGNGKMNVGEFMKLFLGKLPKMRTWNYDIVVMRPAELGATFVTVVGKHTTGKTDVSGFVDSILIEKDETSKFGCRIRHLNAAVDLKELNTTEVLSELEAIRTSSGLVGTSGSSTGQTKRWVVSELLAAIAPNDMAWRGGGAVEEEVRLFTKQFFETILAGEMKNKATMFFEKDASLHTIRVLRTGGTSDHFIINDITKIVQELTIEEAKDKASNKQSDEKKDWIHHTYEVVQTKSIAGGGMLLTLEGTLAVGGTLEKSFAVTMMLVNANKSELGVRLRHMSIVEGIAEGGKYAVPYNGQQAVSALEGPNRDWSVSEVHPMYFKNVAPMSVLENQLSELEGKKLSPQNASVDHTSTLAFVHNFFREMMSKEMKDDFSSIFRKDVTMYVLVPDTPDDFFAKKFREVSKAKEDSKRWDDLAFQAPTGVEKIIKEFVESLPDRRHITYEVVRMLPTVGEGMLVTIEVELLYEGKGISTMQTRMVLLKDEKAKFKYKIRYLTHVEGTTLGGYSVIPMKEDMKIERRGGEDMIGRKKVKNQNEM